MYLRKVFPLVILAAGEGRRMGEVKPLVRLLGLSLLERTILSFSEAGIRKFYVVVGHRKEDVKRHVEEIRERRGIDVETIDNDEWEKGNGTSVLAIRGKEKKFFVTMVDHFFEKEIIEDFIKNAREENWLLVDREIDRVHNVEEATKVRLEDGKIVDIGKELKEYNAIDTGLFFFNEEIFVAIEEAMKEGDANLAAGVKKLAEKGKIYGHEKKQGYWIDADTKDELRMAEKLILKSIPKKEDGIISFNLNRKVSLKISKWLCNFNISPNLITFLSFLIAITGSMLFYFGKYIYTALAGIIIQFASIIDGCDGELARLKFLSSPYGAWLDTIMDRYADAIVTIFVTYNGWLIYGNIIIWFFGFFSLLAFIMASYSRKEYELRYNEKLESKINNLSKRDIRLFSIFVGSLLNKAFEFMVAIAVLHHAVIAIDLARRRK